MAPETKERKRKAAAAAPVVAEQPKKKTKKSTTAPVEKAEETTVVKTKAAPKEKTTAKKEVAAKAAAKATPASKAKPRKRAVDFLSDDEKEVTVEETEEKTVSSNGKVEKISKKRKGEANGEKVIEETVAVQKVDDAAEEEESDLEPLEEDDQTEALLKGFESEGDDDDISGDEGFAKGQDLPALPDYKKTSKKLRNSAKSSEGKAPGVVYVGRIPHGFYENEMKAYFSQFGDISRLRLSRNRRTGRSKHYAFIEFASAAVAQIVADTMDNYLMFGHILKCKFVPAEHLHGDLWKGANRRFKKTPWNKIERANLVKGKSREQWTKKIEAETEKRKAKAEKMKELGYEFDMPVIKAIDFVPIQAAPEQEKSVELTVVADEPAADAAPKEAASKKAKKTTKAKAAPVEEAPAVTEEPVKAKKEKKTAAKKGKKASA